MIGERFDAVWEPLGIGDEVAIGVSTFFVAPTIVDDNVFIADVLHAGADHRVSRLSNDVLIDLVAKGVPTIPAQRGRLSKGLFVHAP